jgi:hypothetical protein
MVCLMRLEGGEPREWIIGSDLNDLFRKMQMTGDWAISALLPQMYTLKDDIFLERSRSARRIGQGHGLSGEYWLIIG